MVLYFTSNVVDPPALIYLGKNKFENEDLIKYGDDRGKSGLSRCCSRT